MSQFLTIITFELIKIDNITKSVYIKKQKKK